MSNNFRVGQKVVCVPDWSGEYNYREMYPEINWPIPGAVYTIKQFTFCPALPGGTPIEGIALEEIPDQPWMGCIIRGWPVKEFQPVKFNSLDISLFTRMLTDNKVDA